MGLSVRSIDFTSVSDFSNRFMKCSDSVVIVVFHYIPKYRY